MAYHHGERLNGLTRPGAQGQHLESRSVSYHHPMGIERCQGPSVSHKRSALVEWRGLDTAIWGGRG